MTPRSITMLISTAVCFQLFLLVHTQTQEGYRMHIYKSNLATHLEELFNKTRDDAHVEEKQRIQQAISTNFNKIVRFWKWHEPDIYDRWELRGLNYQGEDKKSTFEGTNVIMTIKGERYGTPEDKVSLLGAHYDSTALSPGVNDDGSGMAAILEIARVLGVAMDRNYCPFLNTIIIVAFDHGERGQYGSQEYVKYLDEEILQKFGVQNFTGAFILDTMLNYDTLPLAQALPPGFIRMFPKQSGAITGNLFSGDFLATISRKDDEPMANLFSDQWHLIAGKSYKQMNVVIDQYGKPQNWSRNWYQWPLLNDFLLRSDHKSFWSRDSQYTQDGLRAVYITDTANYRGYMKTCYHNICDDYKNFLEKREKLDFLQIGAEALMRSLTILATENTDIICSTAAATPGLSFMLLLASFLVWCH